MTIINNTESSSQFSGSMVQFFPIMMPTRTEKVSSAQFYVCNVTGFFQDSLSHLADFVTSSAHHGKFQ